MLSFAELPADRAQRLGKAACGSEDAGLVLGRDVDVVSKQSAKVLHLFRPQLHVVNESFRHAGNELARTILACIDGQTTDNLQTLVVPDTVVSPVR